jgi:hypothetical protein
MIRIAAVVGLWLSMISATQACPWFWAAPYPPPMACPPPPLVRAADPCPCPTSSPAPCPPAAAPTPPIATPPRPPLAPPTAAPPSATIEPPLADPPGTPLPQRETAPPPLAPPANPLPSTPVSQVNDALYPVAQESDPHFFDTYIRTAGRGERRPGGRCVVSFQNLTGREVRLDVDGQRHNLAVGETWRVEPPRQFVWRMEGRPGQSEAVSTNLVGLEIVLRR